MSAKVDASATVNDTDTATIKNNLEILMYFILILIKRALKFGFAIY